MRPFCNLHRLHDYYQKQSEFRGPIRSEKQQEAAGIPPAQGPLVLQQERHFPTSLQEEFLIFRERFKGKSHAFLKLLHRFFIIFFLRPSSCRVVLT